jgi:hypothetical protein
MQGHKSLLTGKKSFLSEQRSRYGQKTKMKIWQKGKQLKAGESESEIDTAKERECQEPSEDPSLHFNKLTSFINLHDS